MMAEREFGDGARELLRTALAAAVPLRIADLMRQELSVLLRRKRCASLSKGLGEHGDRVLFRSKRPGETAQSFGQLAEALATLAFMPGGVTFLGDHYEAHHPELKPRPLAKTRGRR